MHPRFREGLYKKRQRIVEEGTRCPLLASDPPPMYLVRHHKKRGRGLSILNFAIHPDGRRQAGWSQSCRILVPVIRDLIDGGRGMASWAQPGLHATSLCSASRES